MPGRIAHCGCPLQVVRPLFRVAERDGANLIVIHHRTLRIPPGCLFLPHSGFAMEGNQATLRPERLSKNSA